MLKKRLLIVIALYFSVLVACGNESENSSNDMVGEDSAEEMADFGTEMYSEDSDQQENQVDSNAVDEEIDYSLERKVIYTADLQIEVKSYQQSLNDITIQVEKLDGYIVESSMFEDQESGTKSGQITARIPQKEFQSFIQLVEEGSSKVLESSTSGQDVTEEYIDLESRLKSKHVVEERLISFMEQAKKTADLLKISSDLADVQGEIEEITGRMKYLNNKSDLATVSIYMHESNVKLSGTGKEKLNTLEQTKEQFMKSINFLIVTFSTVFVFLVGNLPIISIVGIIIVVILLIIRKNKNKQRK